MLDDLCLDDVGLRRGRDLAEIDLDYRATAGFIWLQCLDGAADPVGGGHSEIQIAIHPFDHAFAAQRRESLIERLADRAELHISRVAERQHAELDAVETRRALAHQLAIDPRGSRRRLALAPGCRDHHQPFRIGERSRIEIGHVHHSGLEAILAGRFRHVGCQTLGIARLAGEHDGQRLGRNRRGRGLRWRCQPPRRRRESPQARRAALVTRDRPRD